MKIIRSNGIPDEPIFDFLQSAHKDSIFTVNNSRLQSIRSIFKTWETYFKSTGVPYYVTEEDGNWTLWKTLRI